MSTHLVKKRKFENVVDAIDTKAAMAVTAFLRHIQAERNRLVKKAQEEMEQLSPEKLETADIIFKGNERFEELVKLMLEQPLGFYVADKENAIQISESPLPELPSNYSNFRVVSIVSGDLKEGGQLRFPYGIIPLPDLGVFAFLHNKSMVSILSTNGRLKSTIEFVVQYARHVQFLMQPWMSGGMAYDNRSGKMYFFDCRYKLLSQFLGLSVSKVVANYVGSFKRCNGIAFSEYSRNVYTVEDSSVLCIPVDGSNSVKEVTIDMSNVPHKLTACTSSNYHLYLKTIREDAIYRMKLHKDGFVENPPEFFAGGFQLIRGVAVDDCGNVFVADLDSHVVNVLSSDGAFLSSFTPDRSSSADKFCPSGVAILHNEPTIVAVTDYFSNCVYLFSKKD